MWYPIKILEREEKEAQSQFNRALKNRCEEEANKVERVLNDLRLAIRVLKYFKKYLSVKGHILQNRMFTDKE